VRRNLEPRLMFLGCVTFHPTLDLDPFNCFCTAKTRDRLTDARLIDRISPLIMRCVLKLIILTVAVYVAILVVSVAETVVATVCNVSNHLFTGALTWLLAAQRTMEAGLCHGEATVCPSVTGMSHALTHVEIRSQSNLAKTASNLLPSPWGTRTRIP